MDCGDTSVAALWMMFIGAFILGGTILYGVIKTGRMRRSERAQCLYTHGITKRLGNCSILFHLKARLFFGSWHWSGPFAAPTSPLGRLTYTSTLATSVSVTGV